MLPGGCNRADGNLVITKARMCAFQGKCGILVT